MSLCGWVWSWTWAGEKYMINVMRRVYKNKGKQHQKLQSIFYKICIRRHFARSTNGVGEPALMAMKWFSDDVSKMWLFNTGIGSLQNIFQPRIKPLLLAPSVAFAARAQAWAKCRRRRGMDTPAWHSRQSVCWKIKYSSLAPPGEWRSPKWDEPYVSRRERRGNNIAMFAVFAFTAYRL